MKYFSFEQGVAMMDTVVPRFAPDDLPVFVPHTELADHGCLSLETTGEDSYRTLWPVPYKDIRRAGRDWVTFFLQQALWSVTAGDITPLPDPAEHLRAANKIQHDSDLSGTTKADALAALYAVASEKLTRQENRFADIAEYIAQILRPDVFAISAALPSKGKERLLVAPLRGLVVLRTGGESPVGPLHIGIEPVVVSPHTDKIGLLPIGAKVRRRLYLAGGHEEPIGYRAIVASAAKKS